MTWERKQVNAFSFCSRQRIRGGRLGWVTAHHRALYVHGLPGHPSGAWWSQLSAATLSGLPSAPLTAHQEGRPQR